MSGSEIGQGKLFEPPPQTKLTLSDRFLVPPFSVLEARAGYWQARKRDWLNLGIQGEVRDGGDAGGIRSGEGREANLLNFSETVLRAQAGGESQARQEERERLQAEIAASQGADPLMDSAAGRSGALLNKAGGRSDGAYGGDYDTAKGDSAWGGAGTSVFDPVLCELCYRWFSPEAGLILDPFAGGSVRGIVAAALGRSYLGIDLRPEQVAANEAQRDAIGRSLAFAQHPFWVCGDSRSLPALTQARYDFVFSCPPYFDLEQYSDDPQDLSNAAGYPAFREAYEEIIRHSVAALKPDRFACFVVGEVRSKQGLYIGLVPDTIRAFEAAGAAFYNEAILVTSVGSLPIRTSRIFGAGRKLGKTHQNVLVFCKGDPAKAAKACGPLGGVALEYGGTYVPDVPASSEEQAAGLWKPDAGSPLSSIPENERVRALLAADLAARAEAIEPGPGEDDAAERLGHARHEFARDWVMLARKLGLRSPGADQRARAPEGADIDARHTDAAMTRLRQFQAGHNELGWVLVGIEAVVCDRKGMALPGAAYETQGALKI